MKIEIVLNEPGELRSLVSGRKSDFKNADLKVVGRMNETDLNFLKQATGKDGYIKGLDLTYATGISAINRHTFQEGSVLTNVRLCSSIRELGWGAFCMCDHLKTISLTGDIECIENYAFNGCVALASVALPKNLKSLGSQTFAGCSKLEEFKIQLSNRSYTTLDGVLFNKKGDTLIKYPAGKKESVYTIPGNTYSINEYAFFLCDKLRTVVIPEGMTTIGDYAFASCRSIQNIELPSTISSIGIGAFNNCDALQSISITAQAPPTFTPNEQQIKGLYVYVPMAYVNAYRSAEGWKDIQNIFGK